MKSKDVLFTVAGAALAIAGLMFLMDPYLLAVGATIFGAGARGAFRED